MFRAPITRVALFGRAASPCVYSFRNSVYTSQLSRYASPPPASPILLNLPPACRRTFQYRPFSSFTPRHFQYTSSQRNGPDYRRFGAGGSNPRRPRPYVLLLRNLRPQHIIVAVGLVSGFYIYNLETVEMTGRRRFNCVSASRELSMGHQSYQEVLNSAEGKILPPDHPMSVMVERVMRRLIPEAKIEGADWKVHVIRDDGMMNAFVLPGGKVFVYTGILPICQDEDGLAAVLGHEIAHVVAHHPAERMSNNLITLGLVFVISSLFDVSGQLPSILLNLMYSLPNSRTQEAEADNIGLMMMSKACFNPEAAMHLWSRMQKAEKETPPQFMSTHPSSYNRMEAIHNWLPKAEAAYEEAACGMIRGHIPQFGQISGFSRWA